MNKKKKAISIITNVLVVVILVFVALVTLSIILSQGKGYTSIFGSAYVAVQSDSMEGTYDADFEGVKGFNKGDLIRIHILTDEEKSLLADPDPEKRPLKPGDIITFYMIKDGERVLNTHRIVSWSVAADGSLSYVTQGDKAKAEGISSQEQVSFVNVVGQYKGGRIAGLGKAVDFFHSPAGFFVCVVLPSLLIVAYFAVNLILTIKAAKASDKQEAYVDEKEKMRQELMNELREAGKIKEEASTPAENTEEKPEEEAK